MPDLRRQVRKNRRLAAIRLGTISLILLFPVFFFVAPGAQRQRPNTTQQPNTTLTYAQPFIEFTVVPVAGRGDAVELHSIRGRVRGAKPGQRIVLYSYAPTDGTWWVQPFVDQPFTEIRRDSTWRSSAHPGTMYAALLVDSTFRPLLTVTALPTEGVFATAIVQGGLPLSVNWWFPLVCGAGGLLAAFVSLFAFYRLRFHQVTKKMNLRFEERLAERMRVAQELHDTLLQGVISASMQLNVAVDVVPADSPAQPSLRHILQLMESVIEEGRNTLRGLRLSNRGTHDMEVAFLRIPEELRIDQRTAYRVVVEGSPRPLQAVIHDEVYAIGREALLNAFRHSGANSIEVELEYAANQMRMLVRDNGCGINPEVLRWGRDGHWGLSGMRERADGIGAKFRVMSGHSRGTEIEVSVPGDIAFQFPPSNGRWGWLLKPSFRMARAAAPKIESEIPK